MIVLEIRHSLIILARWSINMDGGIYFDGKEGREEDGWHHHSSITEGAFQRVMVASPSPVWQQGMSIQARMDGGHAG